MTAYQVEFTAVIEVDPIAVQASALGMVSGVESDASLDLSELASAASASPEGAMELLLFGLGLPPHVERALGGALVGSASWRAQRVEDG